MRLQLSTRYFVAWMVLGHCAGAGAQSAAPLDLERGAQLPFARDARDAVTETEAERSLPHEALPLSERRGDPEHVAKAPPSPLAERPGDLSPTPGAVWIEGYWEWDTSRRDFAWVTGTWLVPEAGKFWVNSYWRRDAKGWYRVPGLWSGGGPDKKKEVARNPPPDAREPAAPPSRPEEPVGMAPGPDYFYIPGEYIPRGGRVVWQPGFWARSQPGWEWIPARWNRRATGWVFREGFWSPASETSNPAPGNRPLSRGSTLASTPAGIASPTSGMNATADASNNVAPPRSNGFQPLVDSRTGQASILPTTHSRETGAPGLASPAENDRKPAEMSQASEGAGSTTKPGASRQPGDTRSGPQGEPSQQPVNATPYGSPPAYYTGRAAMWNARSVVGGFLRRVIP